MEGRKGDKREGQEEKGRGELADREDIVYKQGKGWRRTNGRKRNE